MNTSRLSVALGLPGRLNATHYRQINCPGKSPNVCACHDTLRYPQGSWVLTWTSRRIQRYLSKHINTQADIPGEWWVNVSLRLSSYNSYMCYQTNRHIDGQPNGCVGWGFAYRFTFRQVPYKFEVLVLKRSISILRSFRVVFLYVSEAKVAFFIPTHLPPSFGY